MIGLALAAPMLAAIDLDEPVKVVVDNLGGLALLALVVFLIWQQWRRDRGGLDAQADAAALELVRESREDRRELRETIADLRERVAVLEDRDAQHEQRQAEQLALLRAHAPWDAQMIDVHGRMRARLAQAGVGEDELAAFAVPGPPSLYPWRGPVTPGHGVPVHRG